MSDARKSAIPAPAPPEPRGERAIWMSDLARADAAMLSGLWESTGLEPVFEWLRAPEIGSVMVRGRAGAAGAPFNLGEMTVTRCALRLDTGVEGHAWVPGRNTGMARIAALCDALLQMEAHRETVERDVLAPVRLAARKAALRRAEQAAATKVDFFTMARGENA